MKFWCEMGAKAHKGLSYRGHEFLKSGCSEAWVESTKLMYSFYWTVPLFWFLFNGLCAVVPRSLTVEAVTERLDQKAIW